MFIHPKFLVEGHFSPADLVVSIHPSNRKIDPAVEGQLDQAWEKMTKRAQEKGKNLYNGISYRLNSLEHKGGKLIVDFGTFEYKVRDGLLEIPEYFELSEPYYRKGCHAEGHIRTSDGKYLLVELSGRSMNTNRTEFLGGIMETNVDLKTGEDVFRCLYKELEEEGRITLADIQECTLRAIFQDFRTNVGFFFEVQLAVSFEDLLHRFEREERDTDIKSLRAYDREEYVRILQSHDPDKQLLSSLVPA